MVFSLCGQVAHETVVKAQVRLQLRDVTGKILQVQRALESTQKVRCAFQKVSYVCLGADVWSLGILCVSPSFCVYVCVCVPFNSAMYGTVFLLDNLLGQYVCVCVPHLLMQCKTLCFCHITF